MVNLGQPFDPNAHDPNVAFDPINPGWYAMQIVASEVVKTKGGQGQFLKLTLEMIEATHPSLKSRKVFDRLNLWNQNQQAVAIASSTLSAICKAIGQVDHWDDSTILHNRPLAVKVKVRAAEGKYEASNDVSGYDAVSRLQTGAPVDVTTMAAPPAGAQAAVAPPPQGQPGQVAKPPWKQ